MSKATYTRITNVAIACGILGLFVNQHWGRYAWVTMAFALLSGGVAVASYFIWNFKDDECPNDKPTEKLPHSIIIRTKGGDVYHAIATYGPASLIHGVRQRSYDMFTPASAVRRGHLHAIDSEPTVVLSSDKMCIIPSGMANRHAGTRSKQSSSQPALRYAS
jgi:hypothetical protein